MQVPFEAAYSRFLGTTTTAMTAIMTPAIITITYSVGKPCADFSHSDEVASVTVLLESGFVASLVFA